MPQPSPSRLTRRELLRATLLSAPLAIALGSTSLLSGGVTDATAPAAGQTLPPTPACVGQDNPTPAQTEGPFFTPNSPERASLLEPGLPGTRLLLSGVILTTNCQPIPGALLDFWQADAAGEYDNVGHRLRGHQFADAAGQYSLETIRPGRYPGRTAHLHLKVQAPNGPILTTQLYFPDEPANQSDRIFNPALLADLRDAADGGTLARFDFVLA